MYKSRNKSKETPTASSKGGDNLNGNSKFDYIQPIQAEPLEVKVYNNFDKALRAFRSLVQKERVLSLYKEKQFYEKSSDKKRRKKNEMKRKLLEMDSKNASHKKFKKDNEDDRFTE